MSKMDSLYTQFYDPSEDFLNEPRSFCYELAMELIKKARDEDVNNWYNNENTLKGTLLLLYTWNFAARETKKLNFENVGKVIRECEENLKKLENSSIEDASRNDFLIIQRVFSKFRKLMGQTGASKALSLLNSKLFVMWDTKIRKRLNKELIRGISNGEKTEHYIKYLKGIQKIINDYGLKEKLQPGSIIAKKIDEYNYVKIIMEKSS